LVRIGRGRAVVARVADAVAVAIRLIRVGDGHAIVRSVADVVTVVVAVWRTQLAGVADAVAVGIGLVRVRRDRAIVAGVADAVSVAVGLVGVGGGGTIVARVAQAVTITVRQGGTRHATSGGAIAALWTVAHVAIVKADDGIAAGADAGNTGVGLGAGILVVAPTAVGLELARCRATVSIHGVAVVTLFARGDDAVATTGWRAVRVAAVAIDQVAVVTRLLAARAAATGVIGERTGNLTAVDLTVTVEVTSRASAEQ